MRIENLFTQTPFSNSRISTQKDEKTKVVAREVLASLPSIGFLDPLSWTLGLCVGLTIGQVIVWVKKDEKTTLEKNQNRRLS